MDNDYLFEVVELEKKYRIEGGLFKKKYFYAVNKVSFNIYRNEIVGLVGESGSGKSTIGRLLLKLIDKTNGKILFEGKDIYSFDKQEEKLFRKKTSIIFQDPRSSLNPRMKIYQILEEPLIVHKVKKKFRDEIIKQSIINSGLDISFLDRYPSDLSGGQRQRVAIARAIVLNPEFIVADEPTSALDVSTQLQIIKLIERLKEERALSVLFISHDLNVVGNISDRIIVLYRGKIMEQGRTKDILTSPLHPYTKMLIASLPVNHPKDRGKKELPKEVFRKDVEGGCVFYHRCPYGEDKCKTEPPIKNLKNREVYCHFA
ncbi:MAG: ABC transporter ATP-binding protein [Persephonella sp.]|nr:MAG: ABC transporter ATP-binding protein [Persephonella sp.]